MTTPGPFLMLGDADAVACEGDACVVLPPTGATGSAARVAERGTEGPEARVAPASGAGAAGARPTAS